MKRFSKVLLALILILSVAFTASAFTGVFASAQAMQEGVTITLSGTNKNNTWVTLSGTDIQDDALEVEVANAVGNEPIVLTKIESSGTLEYSNWSTNRVVTGGDSVAIGLSGKCTAEAVLSVTVTYYVQGNPTTTAETVSAYIFASAKQEYTTQTGSTWSAGNWVPFNIKYGFGATFAVMPVNSGSAKNTEHTNKVQSAGTFMASTNKVQDVEITAAVYVDGNRYTQWEDIAAKITFTEAGQALKDAGKDTAERDHGSLDSITITQSSNTGTLNIFGISSDPQNKTATGAFDYDAKEGFYYEVEAKGTADLEFKGTLPTEDSSTYKIELRGYGQTGGIVAGWGAETSAYCFPIINLTVYNVNKGDLKAELLRQSGFGLNKASYTTTSWNTYATKLSNAYKIFGTLNATKSQVATAKSELVTAYNNLVRYAVVYTNHYFYVGKNNKNPVLINNQSTINMKVTNGGSYNASALADGSYQITVEDDNGDPELKDVVFNRSNTQSSVAVNVGADTNYTYTVDQYYWYVDTTELEAAIAAQANRRHLDESGNEMYTEDSWAKYVKAAEDGVKAKNDMTLFQVNIDNATKAINRAEEDLERLDFDTDWLDEGMEWAACIINNEYDSVYEWNTETLFSSSYSQTLYSNLVSSYNNALETIESDDFTKAQADIAAEELWASINALRIRDGHGVMLVDKVRHANSDEYGWFESLGNDANIEPLNTGLSVVFEDILDNTKGTYRLKKADFTEDSWNALMFALYGEYDPADYEDNFFLPANFKEAQFYAGNAGGTTPEAYPVNSEAEELTVPAYTMLHNIWFLPSQADYNACRDNLLEKVNNLEWVVDTAELVQTLDRAEGIDLSFYTQGTASRLDGDIAYVNAMLEKLEDAQLYGDKDAITAEKIDEAVAELIDAIDSLKLKPTLKSDDNEVVLDELNDQDVITGETIDKTAGEILDDFSINNDNEDIAVKIYDAQDREVAETAKVGTGFKLVLFNTEDGEVYEEHTLVIKGDVLGNADVTEEDFNLVFNFAFTDQGIAANSVYFLAGDVNGDGYVDLCDAILIEMMSENS